jgi:hypothetical protein
MHGQKINLSNHRAPKSSRFDQKKSMNNQDDKGSWRWDRLWDNIQELAKMQNMIANSNQTFDRINNLQWQVNTLQKQIQLSQKQMSDLLSYNWLSPKRSIQGLSAFLCKKCNTLGLKPIFDLGYDMTMECRHRCNEMANKRNYQNFQIPPIIQNRDAWAARVLANYLKSHTYIGKHLFSKDITKGFNDFNQVLTPEITQAVIGIPDRYCYYTLKIGDRLVWLDRGIDNLDKEILLTDDELTDFLARVKSTYAIFEIPTEDAVRRILVTLTRY